MNPPSINDTADAAYERWRLDVDTGAQCPNCGHIPTSVIPINVTLDLLDNVLFRCEQCFHTWPDPYQHAPRVQA